MGNAVFLVRHIGPVFGLRGNCSLFVFVIFVKCVMVPILSCDVDMEQSTKLVNSNAV